MATAIRQVEEFFDNPAPFSWWLLTGGAGAGKTRLARHLCQDRQKRGWQAGFLFGDITAAQTWLTKQTPKPDSGVLIIVDYCASRADSLNSVIAALARLPLPMRVRLLLLERNADDPWYRQTLLQTGGNRAAVEGSRYAEPLALQRDEDNRLSELWQLAQAHVKAVAQHQHKSITSLEEPHFKKVLQRVDPALRSLSALLIADQWAHNDGGQQSSLDDILKNYWDREQRNFWQGISEQETALLALATLCQGVDIGNLEFDSTQEKIFGDPLRFNLKILNRISPLSIDSKIAPLKPDLFGEYFILQWIENNSKIPMRLRIFSETSSQVNFLSSLKFIDLITIDFNANKYIIDLYANMIHNNGDYDEISLGFYSGIFINICARLNKDSILYLEKIHDKFRYILQKHPNNILISIFWAKGVVNLINAWGSAGQPEKAAALLEHLSAKAQENAHIPALRAEWAGGVVNLIKAWGDAGQAQKAADLLDDLDTRIQQNPHIPILLIEWAKGAVNTTKAWGDVGQIQRATELHTRLHTIAKQNPQISDIQESWARSSFNLINDWANAGQIKKAEYLLNLIDDTAEQSPNMPTLRNIWAEGTYNLICEWINVGNAEKATTLLNEIDTKAVQNTDILALHEIWAKGAFNLITYWSDIQQNEKSLSIVKNLYCKAKTKDNIPLIKKLWAKGLYNVILSMCNSMEFNKAETLLKSIDIEAQKNNEMQTLRKEWAKGACTLITAFKEHGDEKKARNLLYILNKRTIQNTYNPSLREEWANAVSNTIFLSINSGKIDKCVVFLVNTLYNEAKIPQSSPHTKELNAIISAHLVTTWANARQLEAASDILNRLDIEAQQNPQLFVLREEWAKGAVNLAHAWGRAGRIEETSNLFNRINAESLKNSHSPSLREQWAKAIFNLILFTASAGQSQQAHALILELSKVAEKHPEEEIFPFVLNRLAKIFPNPESQ